MSSYAAYVPAEGRKPGPPVLVRDGFSFWALLFGPFWLLANAAWIPGVLVLAAELIVQAALHGPARGAVGLGIAWLLGLHGQDLRGWHLRLRGWRLVSVVDASSWDAAYARLLIGSPELQTAAAT